ncbi:hypothetical protein [Dishui Lake phycodnavirus 2]|nr:hypothetical protein [Dishui Lake phycodnavirus 2]
MKTPAVRIPLRQNVSLAAFGYVEVKKMTKLARHRALARAIKAGEPPLGLFRRLNALMIFFKNSKPRLSKIFKSDRDWVKLKFLGN